MISDFFVINLVFFRVTPLCRNGIATASLPVYFWQAFSWLNLLFFSFECFTCVTKSSPSLLSDLAFCCAFAQLSASIPRPSSSARSISISWIILNRFLFRFGFLTVFQDSYKTKFALKIQRKVANVIDAFFRSILSSTQWQGTKYRAKGKMSKLPHPPWRYRPFSR